MAKKIAVYTEQCAVQARTNINSCNFLFKLWTCIDYFGNFEYQLDGLRQFSLTISSLLLSFKKRGKDLFLVKGSEETIKELKVFSFEVMTFLCKSKY